MIRINERLIMILLLIVVSAIMMVLSHVAWRRRKNTSPGLYLAICMVGVSIYGFGYAMEIASNSLRGVMFWVRFQHLGIQAIAPSWLLFALAVSGHEKRISKKLFIVLSIISMSLFLSAQTLGWLNLFHHNPRLDYNGTFPVFVYNRSLFNYIALGFYTLCLGFSTLVFLIMILRVAPSFRKQAAIYLIGSLPPWIGAIVHNLGMNHTNVDYTPLALGLGGLIFAYGFLRYRVLDILPLARDTIFENMGAGVLILDQEGRIVDYNPAMETILPEINPDSIGSPYQNVLWPHSKLLELIEESDGRRVELQFGDGPSAAYYRAGLTGMKDRTGRSVGTIISFFDYTHEKHLLDELETQAITDGLTGVYNRQHFDELVLKELSRLKRYGGTLSLIMMDLDGYKQINDNFGHGAGDQALITVAECLKTILRRSDVLARFGGDEFLILLPSTDQAAAVRLAERVREVINAQDLCYEKAAFELKASFGVVSTAKDNQISLAEFYRYADQALYAAKAAGGNQVCVNQAEVDTRLLNLQVDP